MDDDWRILTVRQPWAAAIIRGLKPVENRSWQTSYRGRLWIHAGTKLEPHARAECYELPLAFGAIIGHVRLAGVTRDWAELSDRERDWANDALSNYFWQLADPVALDEPVPMRGLPGLQRVPAVLRSRLHIV